jgi:CDP-4-dehydro-6-deoxyglucose reductase
MPTVTLATGRTFSSDGATTILESARAGGIALEHSCRTGRCGVCKAPVLAGETIVLRPEESLTSAERDAGLVLTCCRAAAGDVALDIEDLGRLAAVEVRTVPARIASLEHVAPGIVRVFLRLPPSAKFEFLAGQYVDVIAEGVRRSYSLANAPRADGLLELLIKRVEDGVLSRFWFERAEPNALIRLEGPLGTFCLRDAAPKHLVFLATGTGIAPVKALLEELGADPARAAGHHLSVYWSNRDADAFCWRPDPAGPAVDFIPLTSRADPAWTGRRGYVQDAAVDDGIDPDDTAVYACGSIHMIASARAKLIAIGLPPKRFFSDAFVSSS